MSNSKVFQDRNPIIDVVRVFSCLIICFYHWRFGPKLFMELGFLGVPFFFVISGYVMVGVYERSLGNSAGVGKFLSARFSRLLPPIFIILSTSYILQGITNFAPEINIYSGRKLDVLISYLGDISILRWPMNVAGLNTPTWSLWVEFRFYLVIAFIILINSRKFLLGTFTNIWLYLIILNLVSPIFSPFKEILLLDNFYYQGNSGSAIFFVIGIYIGIYHLNNSIPVLLQLGFSLILSVPQITYLISSNGTIISFNFLAGITMFFSVIALVFFSVKIRVGFSRFGKLLAIAGRSTYYVYLLHYFLGLYLLRGLQANGIFEPKFLALVVISVVSVFWVIYLEQKLTKRTELLFFSSFGGRH